MKVKKGGGSKSNANRMVDNAFFFGTDCRCARVDERLYSGVLILIIKSRSKKTADGHFQGHRVVKSRSTRRTELKQKVSSWVGFLHHRYSKVLPLNTVFVFYHSFDTYGTLFFHTVQMRVSSKKKKKKSRQLRPVRTVFLASIVPDRQTSIRMVVIPLTKIVSFLSTYF